MVLQISSPAFEHNGMMPKRYTCQGDDVSPPFFIENAPSGTVSYALIMDDPDAPDPAAPKIVWEHWVVWNIAPGSHFDEGEVPPGAVVGKNQRGNNAYGGPCPPIGTHRYFFKLYALDSDLDLPSTSMKKDVEAAMQGHIIEKAELIGLYRSQ